MKPRSKKYFRRKKVLKRFKKEWLAMMKGVRSQFINGSEATIMQDGKVIGKMKNVSIPGIFHNFKFEI